MSVVIPGLGSVKRLESCADRFPIILGLKPFGSMQAEEERKAQEEAAKKVAADKAAAEKDDNPVAFLRNLMSTKTPVQVATAAKELEVEGGPAGRIRVLFEVSYGHTLLPACTVISSSFFHLLPRSWGLSTLERLNSLISEASLTFLVGLYDRTMSWVGEKNCHPTMFDVDGISKIVQMSFEN